MRTTFVWTVSILFITDSLCTAFNQQSHHSCWQGKKTMLGGRKKKKLVSTRQQHDIIHQTFHHPKIDIVSSSRFYDMLLYASEIVDGDNDDPRDDDDGVVRVSSSVNKSKADNNYGNNNNNNNNNNKISSSAIKGEAEDYSKIRDDEFLSRTKRWVVLVDDEESIRLAIGDYLYDQGYQVTACTDADSLLEVCSTSSIVEGSRELPPIPDVIVSDIRMPGKDGLELLKLLKADERLGRVPVILLTAKTFTQDRVLGYKAGADAYLTKPFAPEELVVIIDSLIRRRAQMTGPNGKLLDLKMDMINIKQILKQNGEGVIRQTDVYLTPSEQEVLTLLCKGYSNGEIAEKRGGLSITGINKMIQNLYLKTQTRTRTELVRWAIQYGFVPPR